MRRLGLIFFALAAGASVSMSCARDLEIETPPDPTRSVVAQFDPTHEIPVLQLIPSPTALAEKSDGTLDHALVAPEPCELPTVAQCLILKDSKGEYLVTGWPTTTRPTLYFSTLYDETGLDTGKAFLESDGALDVANIKQGVKLWETQPDGSLVRLDYTPRVSARPAINSSCQDGDNGSNPPKTYLPEAVPSGVQLVLEPTSPLKPATEYLVSVESFGDAGGVRDSSGNAIEPSSLFYLLNSEQEEIAEDGTIRNALLRGQVSQLELQRMLAAKGKRTLVELTEEDRAELASKIMATGLKLRAVERFFDVATSKLLAGAGESSDRIAGREGLVFVNLWHTAPAPTEITFDPLAGKVPFPNSELLLKTSSTARGGYRVNLPIPADADASRRILIHNFNKLNGFSTTAPIVLTATRDVRRASLDGRIVMYPIGAEGQVDGPAVDLVVSTSSGTALAPPSIFIRPRLPLPQNKRFVVGVLEGLLDADGRPVVANSTFNLLKLPRAFVTASGVDPAVEPVLECRPVAAGQSALATAQEVAETAALLELGLNHQGFLATMAALASSPSAIDPTRLIMAFGYKTQDVVTELDEIRSGLRATEIAPLIGQEVVTSTAIAAVFGIPEKFCVPACSAGAMLGDTPRLGPGAGECTLEALATNRTCGGIQQLLTGNLESVTRYTMRVPRFTVGNPYVTGTFTGRGQVDSVDVPVAVFRPKGQPPAANGFPITIFQHGIGRQKEDALTLANTLADPQSGRATAAIDLAFHGERVTDITNNAQGLPPAAQGVPCGLLPGTSFVDPNEVECHGGACTGGCDGVPDDSGTGFLGPNVFSVRDNFRQAVADHLTLIRTLQAEATTGGVLSDLDGRSIAYAGQSLGGIIGGTLAAYAASGTGPDAPPDVESFVLNAGGGGLVDILENTVPAISAGLWAALAPSGTCALKDPENPGEGCLDTAAFRQFKQLAAWAMDLGDPLANSIGVVGEAEPGRRFVARNRMLIQVSNPDPVVSEATGVALAEAYGFEVGVDSRIQVYDFSCLPAASTGSGCHGWFLAPICGRNLNDAICHTFGAQRQAAVFMKTQATVVLPQPALEGCERPCP